MQIGKDLVAATATPLVLGILADGESYGYAILQRIGELSDGQLDWSDGMLYPLLHRLERLGQIESRWELSPTGRRRKLYRLSATGTAALAEHRKQWSAVTDALAKIWSPDAAATGLAIPPGGGLLQLLTRCLRSLGGVPTRIARGFTSQSASMANATKSGGCRFAASGV